MRFCPRYSQIALALHGGIHCSHHISKATFAWQVPLVRRSYTCWMVDVPLNHDVFRTADHQQMLNVVAANENEPTTSINRNRIDHR